MSSMVASTRDGHLLCDDDHTYWCEHIEKIVRDGTDQDLIWDAYPAMQTVEVPVMPTANIWATVALEASENVKVQIYTVRFEPDPGYGDEEFIGFIHPSEGRAVLREMMIDWFIGTKEPFVGKCQAPGHGYKQAIRWNNDMEKRPTAVPQLWAVWATGKCLGCTYDLNANPDLVPDDPRSNNVWNH